jgi:hypothetical protein
MVGLSVAKTDPSVGVAAIEYHRLTGKLLGITGEIAELEAAALVGSERGRCSQCWLGCNAATQRSEADNSDQGARKHDGKKYGRVSSLDIKKKSDVEMLVLMHGGVQLVEGRRARSNWRAARDPREQRMGEAFLAGTQPRRDGRSPRPRLQSYAIDVLARMTRVLTPTMTSVSVDDQSAAGPSLGHCR